MSWFSKNYEKATLGGAALVAVSLLYFGWSKLGSVEEDFAARLKGDGNNDTAVAGADQIPKAVQSMKLDRTWEQVKDGDRPVNLFTGIALFVGRDAPEKPIDLVKGSEIHPPIPNKWWLDYRLDPGFADSPQRDPDGDGFSNIEEWEAKTDPTSSKSLPALIAKLMYVKDESLVWVLRPGYGSEGKFPFNYEDSNRQTNRVRPSEMVGPNELFFAEDPMANRFKLLGSEVRREMNEAVNVEMDITYVRIEDQRPNKKGKIYELPSPLSEQRKGEYLQYDRTAVLTLEALGKNGTEFKIEEHTPFALPPGAENKDYLLKSVTPESIEVEYTDPSGARATVKINKGSFPDMP